VSRTIGDLVAENVPLKYRAQFSRDDDAEKRPEIEKWMNRAMDAATAQSALTALTALTRMQLALTTTQWLCGLCDYSVHFASHVAKAMPHYTPRHSTSNVSTAGLQVPPSDAPVHVVTVAESITSMRELPNDEFWSALPPVADIQVNTALLVIKGNAAIKSAFDLVVAAREKNGEADEIHLVHPFARLMFETIDDAVSLPRIHLYKERDMGIDDELTRHPDMLFYEHDNDALPSTVNACMQRNGRCAIELKSILDAAHAKLAVSELLRDFARTVGEGIEETKRDFYGLMGDGVEWEATSWFVVVRSATKPFAARSSGRFTLKLDSDDSVREFVSRILRLRAAAALPSRHHTGWSNVPLQGIQVERVLAVTGACVVARCVYEGRTIALKIGRRQQDGPRCERDATVRESLGLDPPPPGITVCRSVSLFGVRPVLWLETVGTVLEDMCSERVRVALACVVRDDIGAALTWLHEKGWAFVDLHPGNIVISGGRAFLIDLESCSELDKPTDAPICASFRTVGDDLIPTRATDRLGLTLVLAWILDLDQFRSHVAGVASLREAGVDIAKKLLQNIVKLEKTVESAFGHLQ
jgi:hypothetical protein